MKKALLIAVALGLICAWSVPSMATDWSAIGGFGIKSLYYKNVDYRFPVFTGGVPGSNRVIGTLGTTTAFSGPLYGLNGILDPAWNRESWFITMRGNIYIIAKASADLQGVFGIEVNSARFGDVDSAIQGSTSVVALGGTAGRWNADAIAIQVKNMYIDFKVPAVPMRMKAGIQSYYLRTPVFLSVDAAGLSGSLSLDLDPVLLKVNPFWAVITHGSATLAGVSAIPSDWTTADDGNLFGVDINAAIGLIKPGVFFAMQRQGQLYDSTVGRGGRTLWWAGAYTDANFGPLAINLDYIYNGGYDEWESGVISIFDSMDPAPLVPVIARTYSVRHEGWLFRGEASYTLNKFRFGVGGLYGTGDNLSTPDKNEAFKGPNRTESTYSNKDFVVLTGDYGLRSPFGYGNVGGLYKAWSTPGQGVWYVRGFADYAVTDWLKLKVNGGYIGDTCRGFAAETFAFRGGDEFGTDADNDDSIGWELDAAVQVDIYKNLLLSTSFGYLIAGKALAGQYLGYRAQDPWVFAVELAYTF